jgi:hypothetical protein
MKVSKKRTFILLSTIVIMIYLLSTVYFIIKTNNSFYKYSICYRVAGHTLSESENQTIYSPIPLTRDGKPILLLYELAVIKGNARCSMIDTQYGLALKIDFTEAFEIMAYKEFTNRRDERYLIYSMSMPIGNGEHYLFYLASMNSTLKINFLSYDKFESQPGRGSSSYSYHHYEWNVENYHLIVGWQKAHLLKTWECD